MLRRVAVTGLGAITAAGRGVTALDAAMREGRSGIAEVTLFDPTGYRTSLAAQAPDPEVDLPFLIASRPDRFGIIAAEEAVAAAGLSPEDLRRAACVMGTGTGGAHLTEAYLEAWLGGGEEAADPALLVCHQPASVTDLICRRMEIGGPRSTIMTACSSSATAIGHASDLIRTGRLDVALAGGADGLCRLTYAGFNSLRALSADPCRPFDVARKGITLGEGAAVLILGEAGRAVARGARILGYVGGWGMCADAHHMTAPHPEGDGAARAMSAALDDAGLSAAAIGQVNAHGTGTPHNDVAEAKALARVFGAQLPQIPVSSTKSMHGHALGAAGAIEATVSILALVGGYVPPTVGLEQLDPACGPLDISAVCRERRVDAVLSSSFAFGGNNTVLIFTRN